MTKPNDLYPHRATTRLSDCESQMVLDLAVRLDKNQSACLRRAIHKLRATTPTRKKGPIR